MTELFEDLYESEINWSVQTFWDNGYDVLVGDDCNGWVAENNVDTWVEVEQWLQDTAIRCFPHSEFADKYRRAA